MYGQASRRKRGFRSFPIAKGKKYLDIPARDVINPVADKLIPQLPRIISLRTGVYLKRLSKKEYDEGLDVLLDKVRFSGGSFI